MKIYPSFGCEILKFCLWTMECFFCVVTCFGVPVSISCFKSCLLRCGDSFEVLGRQCVVVVRPRCGSTRSARFLRVRVSRAFRPVLEGGSKPRGVAFTQHAVFQRKPRSYPSPPGTPSTLHQSVVASPRPASTPITAPGKRGAFSRGYDARSIRCWTAD